VRWTVAEKDQLKRYFEQAATTPVWSELAERLDTGRTWKQVQTMARQLELTEPTHRAAGGPAWEAQRCVQGAKDKKRKAPASAALTLASPAGVPPSEPRPKRPTAAAAALAIKQSALEGDAADTLTFFAGLDAEHHRRMDWARHYVLKLHAPSNREWDGRGGTVAIIRKEFGVPQGSTASIRSVLEDVSACLQAGVEYTGRRSQVARARAEFSRTASKARSMRTIGTFFTMRCRLWSASSARTGWSRRVG
jgi:hypothetical protein